MAGILARFLVAATGGEMTKSEIKAPFWAERITTLEAHLAHARECMRAVVKHCESVRDGEGYDPQCFTDCHCPVCNVRHCLSVTSGFAEPSPADVAHAMRPGMGVE